MDDFLSPQDVARIAKERGLSIAEVCRRAKIAPSTYHRWAGGKSGLTVTVYRKIRDVLAAAKAAPLP